METILGVTDRLADEVNRGESGARICQLICSQCVISGPHLVWLFVWRCCQQSATLLREPINAGFAPAMFFDSARRRSPMWSASPLACEGSGPTSAKVVAAFSANQKKNRPRPGDRRAAPTRCYVLRYDRLQPREAALQWIKTHVHWLNPVWAGSL